MATSESISGFFDRLGFKLNNRRTSWGGLNGEAVLLRTWSDEVHQRPWRVRVLRNRPRDGKLQRVGRAERKAHLRAAWAGGIPIYTVIVTPKPDKQTGERRIGPFDSHKVFPIEGFVEEDGSIFALYGPAVAVQDLPTHMQTYRIAATTSPMPAMLTDTSDQIPTDPVEKAAFLAREVRTALVAAAERGEKLFYGDLFDDLDLNHLNIRPVLNTVGKQCVELGEPVLTALVVNKDGPLKGRCSAGFSTEFGVDEDEERARVWARWNPSAPTPQARVEWTDDELQASVAAYREMMLLDKAGTAYVKEEYYRQLEARFGRGAGGYARRMQNISYLLDSRGLPWLPGLKPQENVGVNVEPRLLGFLEELFTELTPPATFAEDIDDPQGVIEGAKKQVTVNAYERDASAKARCIKRWGCVCVVCTFDFGDEFGELGEGFIHVHHLKPIHTIGEAYVLIPEEDLRPVCPNCHAMLHRKKDVLSIEDLQAIRMAQLERLAAA